MFRKYLSVPPSSVKLRRGRHVVPKRQFKTTSRSVTTQKKEEFTSPATSRDNFHLINACTENPSVDPSTLASVHCMDLYFPIRAQLRCMAKNCESFKPFLPNCSCNFIPSVTERTLTAFSCKYHREISSSARQTHFHHTRTFSVIFQVLLISKLLFEQTRQTKFHSLPQARIFASLAVSETAI
jgi:hypothetical protein